jgi:hypothetical protein
LYNLNKWVTIEIVGLTWSVFVARRRDNYRDNVGGNRRRSSSTRRKSSNYSSGGGGRKSAAEARVERLTWFSLVMVFAGIYFFQEASLLPNWIVPMIGAIIILGSGVYQYSRGWRVSPVTWIAGTLMLSFAGYAFAFNSQRDFLGFSLIVFAFVIGFGVLTGET